jgi:RHS repeat-associated protein
MTSSVFSYTNGNRKWRNYAQSGVQRYAWDMIGRMTSACGASTGARYFYRADGMRIKKIDGLTINWVIDDEITGSGHYDEITDVNMPTYRYYYDGQMCMEEDKTWGISQPPHGPNVEVTQYGIGARGIDYIYKKFKQAGSSTWNTTAEQFPLYDGHGNMVATLSRDGSSFAIHNRRMYDVWGGVRNETDLDNAPNTKYCANLGHKEDDESGLIYMRARYYEPWTGRFVSEDKGRDGWNWYVYCKNNPLTYIDFSGNNALSIVFLFIGVFSLLWTVGQLVPALQEFATHLAKAQNGLEVEEIWANFMAGFRGTQLLDDDISGLIRLVGLVFAMKAFSKGKYPVLYDIGVFIAGLNLGIKASFLCYAYQLRIAWYIDDINRD